MSHLAPAVEYATTSASTLGVNTKSAIFYNVIIRNALASSGAIARTRKEPAVSPVGTVFARFAGRRLDSWELPYVGIIAASVLS
jgi:hypothetical protein